MKDLVAWGLAIYITVTFAVSQPKYGGLLGMLVILAIFVALPMWGYMKVKDGTFRNIMIGILILWSIVVSLPSDSVISG